MFIVHRCEQWRTETHVTSDSGELVDVNVLESVYLVAIIKCTVDKIRSKRNMLSFESAITTSVVALRLA